MVLCTGLEEVVVLAVRTGNADGEVGEQLALEAEEQLIRVRRLHAVVETSRRGGRAGRRRIDVVDADDASEISPLRDVVAVVVDTDEVEVAVGAERAGAERLRAELVDVAVVARAQQRLLVGAERVGETDTRCHGAPLQRTWIAGIADRRQQGHIAEGRAVHRTGRTKPKDKTCSDCEHR